MLASTFGLSACTEEGHSKPEAQNKGIAAKSPQEIFQAAAASLRRAKTVHVVGAMLESGNGTTLDAKVNGSDAQGKMSIPQGGRQIAFDFVQSDGRYYLRGNQMLRTMGGSEAAKLVGDRWAKTSITPQMQGFADYLNLTQMANHLATTGQGFNKSAVTTLLGQQVVPLTGDGTTFYIAATGEPRLVQFGSGRPGDYLSYQDYDAPVTVTPPADAIDVAKLGPKN